MRKLTRRGWFASALGAAMVASVGGWPRLAGAQPAPGSDQEVWVVIGAVRCFVVRRPEGALGVQDRVDHVYDVFNRYLGGDKGEFTLVKPPKGSTGPVQVLMNGDQVINVTTNDARADLMKSAEQLAAVWKKGLEQAFAETHVRSESQHP